MEGGVYSTYVLVLREFVSLWRVILGIGCTAFTEGATAEEIAQQYPSLSLADVYSVIGYYLRRRSDVEVYLRQRRQVAHKTRKDNESLFDPSGVRDRLLARRSNRST